MKRPSEAFSFKIPPWDHQKEALDRASPVQGFALFFQMGTGKTATACYILQDKFGETPAKTLILCPLIVCQQWLTEFYQYAPAALADSVCVLAGTSAQRLKQFERGVAQGKKIFVTNYEALRNEDLFQALYAWQPECIVFDESHKLKNIRSKVAKQCIQLADRADRCRLILSGTPVLNSPLDLFSQFRVMDRGATFGTNVFSFRANHFVDKNAHMPRQRYFPNWVPTEQGLQKINAAIQEHSLRVTKEECLDLPPLVKQVVHVDLSTEQRRLYDEMKRDFVSYMDDKACVATIALTKALRLQQIASGYVALRDEAGVVTEQQLEQTPRAAALRELLSEIAPYHKVIVWAVFKKNYDEVRSACKALSLPMVEIHGEITAATKFEAVHRFSVDPLVRVLLGHPGAGGVGVNLTAASYTIFYSRGFSLEADLQSESRNHRSGSEIHAKITRIDIVATGTIDEEVARALAAKEEIGEKLLRRLKDAI